MCYLSPCISIYVSVSLYVVIYIYVLCGKGETRDRCVSNDEMHNPWGSFKENHIPAVWKGSGGLLLPPHYTAKHNSLLLVRLRSSVSHHTLEQLETFPPIRPQQTVTTSCCIHHLSPPPCVFLTVTGFPSGPPGSHAFTRCQAHCWREWAAWLAGWLVGWWARCWKLRRLAYRE